jgi:hypothetical protein
MFLGSGVRLYVDWLWFSSLGHSNVFLTILFSDIGIRVAVGLAFFVFLFVNLLLTRQVVLEQGHVTLQEGNVVQMDTVPWQELLNKKMLTLLFLIVSTILAYLFALSVAGDWALLQKFLNPSTFGVVDPIFGKDVGFYVFTLPFQIFLFNILFWTGIITILFVGLAYFISNPFRGLGAVLANSFARAHLSGLLAFVLLVKAWGYLLQQYLLLYSARGVVFGAGYTDTNATMFAYRVLLVLAVIAAAAVIANIMLRRTNMLIYAVGGLVVVSLVLGSIYPAALQRFVVTPNELNREWPYIEHGIAFTRMAYDLDKIEQKPFPAGRTVDWETIEANDATISNIRLWDHRPLKDTYAQRQQIRLYYEFKDVDIDRYLFNGEYRQVMLAARELEQNELPDQAQTWINQRLVFTHGFGVAMSPVNEVTPDGLPSFLIQDIPPVIDPGLGLSLERPEIYFGEATDQYVIVQTNQLEFNFPKGDENIHTTWSGDNGIELGSFLRRAALALALSDFKIMLSTDIRPDSQILLHRNIWERVPKIAPFLGFDQDPYIVVNNDQLYWIWDAYTTTNMFPYSEPFEGRLNYIRNAVKVVIDAYTGEVNFYVAEPDDPIIQTFGRIFPGMFRDLDEMPEGLRAHIRYPVDMFRAQAQMYTSFHMEHPQVFYNREDKWRLPTEIIGQEQQSMEPYYTIMRLPGEEQPEFVLIMPFTPQGRQNMIGWMAARSDGENYGEVLVYEMPKASLVYGPMQVEARINQDQYISQQLNLWEGRGSRVIRGNLLAIPIEDSLLYIEPIFLQAEAGRMPELRRVALLHGDRVVFEPDLLQALAAMFGGSGDPTAPTSELDDGMPGDPLSGRTLADLIADADREFTQAQERLREGDWSGYGRALEALGKTLEELAQRAGE